MTAVQITEAYAEVLVTGTSPQRNITETYLEVVAQSPASVIPALAPQAWWRADHIMGQANGSTLTSWSDESGNNLTASNGSSNALYTTNQSPTGLPCVRFQGTGLSTSVPAGGAAQTIAAVVRVINTSGYRTIVGANNTGNGLQLRVEQGTNQVIVNESHQANVCGSVARLAINTWYVILFTYTVGGAWEFRINGVQDSTGTSSVPFVSSSRQIGNDQTDAFYGDEGELVTWATALAPADRIAVETELMSRWIAPQPTGPTFAIGETLFGTRYAAGAAVPALSASVQRSLLRRGRLLPSTSLTFRKAAKVNGVSYAAGAAWPGGATERVTRQLLRGKIIK